MKTKLKRIIYALSHSQVEEVTATLLGFVIDMKLSREVHIGEVYKKLSEVTFLMRKIE